MNDNKNPKMKPRKKMSRANRDAGRKLMEYAEERTKLKLPMSRLEAAILRDKIAEYYN
jgi:hypothetical protein